MSNLRTADLTVLLSPFIVSELYCSCLLLFPGGVLTTDSSHLVETAVKTHPEKKEWALKVGFTYNKWTLEGKNIRYASLKSFPSQILVPKIDLAD